MTTDEFERACEDGRNVLLVSERTAQRLGECGWRFIMIWRGLHMMEAPR